MRNSLFILLLVGLFGQLHAQTFKAESDSIKLHFGFPTLALVDTISFMDENENRLLEPDESSVAVFTIKNTSKYPAKEVMIAPEELNGIEGFDGFKKVEVGDIPAGAEKRVEIGINSTEKLKAGTANFVFHLFEKGVENDISIVFTIATSDVPMEFDDEDE
ncbi:MAG: hypothetical protein MRZ79_06425 [Bacteroidia bacterium]|nr:hypothetical protein [Bacteroidia bacterium]